MALRPSIMLKISPWIGIVLAFALLLALLLVARRNSGSSWALRTSPRLGFNAETGYLVDSIAGEGGSELFLSGRWYRFGPVQLQQRWPSRRHVTNVAIMSKVWSVF